MNIAKRDVLELRRRLTKRECSISRMSGCYVNGMKEILLRFNEPFLDLEEEEFYKYLEIAKKSLSGTLGNNLLELNFDRTEDAAERQQFLLALKSSKLQNEALLDRFYEQVIAHYTCSGNYLILVFHDVYDVMTRTRDNAKLDESEEIYTYMICAICPVDLSKPGLGYREDENRIGVCARDWIVGMPEVGFVYPAFSGRSSDVNAVMYYVKNGANTHPEFVTDFLGCQTQRTAAQDKKLFQTIVENAFGEEQEQAENAYLKSHRNLDGVVAVQAEQEDQPEEAMTPAAVADMIADVEMPEPVRAEITRAYAAEFGETLPTAGRLLDAKLAAEGAKRAHTLELERKVETLQAQLARQTAQPAPEAEDPDDVPWDEGPSARVVVQVPEERRAAVHAQMVDGRRCLVIPLETDETARINGQDAAL